MEYGLIVKDDTTGSRATFLPKVFENASWNIISKELINKANINISNVNMSNVNMSNTDVVDTDSIKFYAYKAIVFQRRIIDRLTTPYLNFMYIYFKKDVPYSIASSNNSITAFDSGYTNIKSTNIKYIVEYKKNEYIRNVSTINDIMSILEYNEEFEKNKKIKLMNICHKHTDKYISLFLKSNSSLNRYRQSLPFLLQCITHFNSKYSTHANIIVNYLIDNMTSIRETDPVFEYGEVITGLGSYAQYLSLTNNDSNNNIDKINKCITNELNFIKKQILDIEISDDTIFQLNWLSQSVRYIYFSLNMVDIGVNANIDVGVNTIIKIIVHKLTKVTKILLQNIDTQTESNYLCVAFEAFCSLYQICDNSSKILCSDMIKNLFIEIMHRMNHYGLIDFTSGDARIDITGHFFSGLMYLINKKQMNQSGGNYVYTNTYQTDYICNKKMYMKLKSINSNKIYK